MTNKRVLAVAATMGAATTLILGTAAPASAINNIKGFGVRETLKDYYSLSDFSSEIGYTVKNLRPSRDPVPYPVAGRLYESNVTAESVVGTVFPQPNNFVARTSDGADYRALNVSTVSGAPLGPGGSTTGKLYFDVVGDNPDSVVFNGNFQDLLGWVGNQPIDPESIVPGTEAGSEAAPSGGGGGAESGGATGGSGGASVPGSTGPNLATPSIIGGNGQNGPYGPSGNVPPVGRN